MSLFHFVWYIGIRSGRAGSGAKRLLMACPAATESFSARPRIVGRDDEEIHGEDQSDRSGDLL